MNAIYERIYNLCVERGESVTAVAKLAGVSPGRISDLKNGRSDFLSLRNAVKLAEKLGTTPDYILYGKSGSVLVLSAEKEKIDFRGMIRTVSTQDLIGFLRDAADELRQREIPESADLSALAEEDLFDKIREYSAELGRRRGQGVGAAVKLHSDGKE